MHWGLEELSGNDVLDFEGMFAVRSGWPINLAVKSVLRFMNDTREYLAVKKLFGVTSHAGGG